MRTLLVRTLERWRDWLAEHHASESEVWLIFHKRHTGVASIAYEDARDEALAPSQRRRYFAWIESAKREETKLRRLEEAIRLLASGKVLGLK